jgi:plasmid stabilization system protein ParE
MPVTWSQSAFNDLEAIYDYLKQHDPNAVARSERAIRSKAVLLSQFPELGSQLDDRARRLSVPNTPYVIVYELQARSVSVLRVFDTPQDWQHRIDET